jgi:tetratricopeptide (TPR) repeat protein
MSAKEVAPKTSEKRKLGIIVIVAMVIAGLAVVDTFLARVQDAEVQRTARQSFREGLLFSRNGKADQAIEAFRKAHALEREKTEYELELIKALTEAGKSDQAELLMREVLEREPNGGRANLLAAHIMIAKGKDGAAESYYHRAIYGEWPDNADAHRISVRMELADFLAAKGKKQELLAELLPLQEQSAKDPAADRRIAQLFLAADSPSHAANEYRALIKRDPGDASAYAGLGDAELKLGDYRPARDAFLSAAARNPEDASIRHRVELSSTLNALDPTARRLTSVEKYRRSLRILELAQAELDGCIAKHPAAASDKAQQLLASANDMVKQKAPAAITNELAEHVLGLADETFQNRVKLCGTPDDDDPLRLIMQKVAQ